MAVGSRPVVSCRISLWAERGRTIARKAGRWRVNTSAPTRQQRAPIRSMWGAVRCVATVPATRPPATAWAEGTQFNGRPFPATASAEGAQLNGRPSLPRRRPPRAAAHEIVWWTTCHAPESMARHIHSTALRHPAHSTCAPRHRIGPVPHLFHEHPVWLGQAGLAWRGTVAHATIVPACCHLSLYIITICRWGLCSRSPQSTSQGATVCASTHKGGMAPIMARGQQAGVSVGTEHASCRSSSSALQHGDSPERRNN